MSLKNKVAIVTGAAQGIGLAIAKRFVEEGVKVVIADTNEKHGDEVEKELSDLGDASFVHCDVSERLSVRNLVAATLNAYDDIDILVNNAAVYENVNFLKIREEEFERVLSVNLKGAYLCSQAVANHIIEKNKEKGEGGAIINITSAPQIPKIDYYGAYAISKAGLDQMTKVLSQTLLPHKIRVNAIGPGYVHVNANSKDSKSIESPHLIDSANSHIHVGDPKDIASIAVFLASQESEYITGQTIIAEGGNLMRGNLSESDSDE